MTSPEDLNAKARALVDAGRAALGATAGDRERIEAALRAQLGPDALPVEADIPSASAPTAWRPVARLAIGVGVVVGAAFVALRPPTLTSPPHPSVQHAPSPTPAAPQEVSAAADALLPTPTAVIAEPAPPAPKVPQPSTSHRPDGLAQEVALLSRAATQLRAGRAAKALKALDEHERRFPKGALSEERRAAKAQALCLLGRGAKGRAELAQLPAQSPAAARAIQVCDSELSEQVVR